MNRGGFVSEAIVFADLAAAMRLALLCVRVLRR